MSQLGGCISVSVTGESRPETASQSVNVRRKTSSREKDGPTYRCPPVQSELRPLTRVVSQVQLHLTACTGPTGLSVPDNVVCHPSQTHLLEDKSVVPFTDRSSWTSHLLEDYSDHIQTEVFKPTPIMIGFASNRQDRYGSSEQDEDNPTYPYKQVGGRTPAKSLPNWDVFEGNVKVEPERCNHRDFTWKGTGNLSRQDHHVSEMELDMSDQQKISSFRNNSWLSKNCGSVGDLSGPGRLETSVSGDRLLRHGVSNRNLSLLRGDVGGIVSRFESNQHIPGDNLHQSACWEGNKSVSVANLYNPIRDATEHHAEYMARKPRTPKADVHGLLGRWESRMCSGDFHRNVQKSASTVNLKSTKSLLKLGTGSHGNKANEVVIWNNDNSRSERNLRDVIPRFREKNQVQDSKSSHQNNVTGEDAGIKNFGTGRIYYVKQNLEGTLQPNGTNSGNEGGVRNIRNQWESKTSSESSDLTSGDVVVKPKISDRLSQEHGQNKMPTAKQKVDINGLMPQISDHLSLREGQEKMPTAEHTGVNGYAPQKSDHLSHRDGQEKMPSGEQCITIDGSNDEIVHATYRSASRSCTESAIIKTILNPNGGQCDKLENGEVYKAEQVHITPSKSTEDRHVKNNLKTSASSAEWSDNDEDTTELRGCGKWKAQKCVTYMCTNDTARQSNSVVKLADTGQMVGKSKGMVEHPYQTVEQLGRVLEQPDRKAGQSDLEEEQSNKEVEQSDGMSGHPNRKTGQPKRNMEQPNKKIRQLNRKVGLSGHMVEQPHRNVGQSSKQVKHVGAIVEQSDRNAWPEVEQSDLTIQQSVELSYGKLKQSVKKVTMDVGVQTDPDNSDEISRHHLKDREEQPRQRNSTAHRGNINHKQRGNGTVHPVKDKSLSNCKSKHTVTTLSDKPVMKEKLKFLTNPGEFATAKRCRKLSPEIKCGKPRLEKSASLTCVKSMEFKVKPVNGSQIGSLGKKNAGVNKSTGYMNRFTGHKSRVESGGRTPRQLTVVARNKTTKDSASRVTASPEKTLRNSPSKDSMEIKSRREQKSVNNASTPVKIVGKPDASPANVNGPQKIKAKRNSGHTDSIGQRNSGSQHVQVEKGNSRVEKSVSGCVQNGSPDNHASTLEGHEGKVTTPRPSDPELRSKKTEIEIAGGGSAGDKRRRSKRQEAASPTPPHKPRVIGGRSRSTNGSVASISSNGDQPRGSGDGSDKQASGKENKIINIDFASSGGAGQSEGSTQALKDTSAHVPTVRQQPPEFIIKPRRQLADEGESAKFKVSFDGSPDPDVTWQFCGQVLTNDSRHKICEKDDFHYLEIHEIVPEDAGKYSCIITNTAGKASLSTELEVFEKPKSIKSKMAAPTMEIPLKDVTSKEGQRNVTLECKVKASYDSEATWYKDGKNLRANRDLRLGFDGAIAKLHFYELKMEDHGEYECVVKNSAGEAKCSATLSVKAAQPKSFPPKFTKRLENQNLQDGERLIFQATVTGSPEPTIKWMRNGKEIRATEDILMSFNGSEVKLQIEDVLPEDSGEFTCQAHNDAGQDKTKATLHVTASENSSSKEERKEPPRFLKELENIQVNDGDRVEMVVQVEGTPPIDVVWVFNNKEIPSDNPDYVHVSEGNTHKLIIQEAFPEDSGEYVCEIYNDYGDTESVCALSVKESTVVPRVPEFVTKPKSVLVEEGSGASFTCHVTGNPAPSVDWEVNGKSIIPGRRVRVSQSGEDYGLEIPHTVCGDSGRYTCVVSNSVGTVSHTASLNVTPLDKDEQEHTDFRSLLKARPGLAAIGSQDSTESIQSEKSEKSEKGEVEQHDFRKVLTRPVETKQRPKFKTLLQDQKTKEGGEITLCCELRGEPQITWSVNGKPVKASKYFRMNYQDRVAELVIAEAYPEDEGEYTCTATNTAGAASCSCDIYVEVSESASDSDKMNTSRSSDQLEAPKIMEFEPTNVSVRKGKSVQVKGRISGEPEPEVKWFHNKTQLKSDGHMKMERRRDLVTLTITDIMSSDGGKYKLVVENAEGSQEALSSISVEDIPNPPAGKPHVSAVSRTSVTLAWYGPAYDGGSQVTSYRIEMCKAKDQVWRTLTSACKNTSYEVKKLVPETLYQFRVSAGNKHGLSDAGQTSDPVLTSDNYDPKSEPESDVSGNVQPPISPIPTNCETDELPFEPHDVKVAKDRLFEDEYELKEELGKGKYGNVYRCIEKSSGLSWAAKVIKCREKDKAAIRQEVGVMNKLRHPKLLMLWDAFEASRVMVLIMEYIAGGELFERIINDDFVLTERDCVHFMRQICDGVCYMHDRNILHLDLKPENILCISPNSNQIKIIDFGLARPYNPGESTKVMLGTPEFIAPEVINYDEIGFTTDMWSLGVVCYVLLSGLSPFLGDSDPETLVNVTLGEFDFDDDAFNDISDNAKDFIEKLVIKNKEKRLTVHQCLKHKWLAQDVKRMRLKRLNTNNLKKFMARRKWQKMGNAIRAIGRMAALQRSLRSSSPSNECTTNGATKSELPASPTTQNGPAGDVVEAIVSSHDTPVNMSANHSPLKVGQMVDNFRQSLDDQGDESDSEYGDKRSTLTSSASKDSGIDTYKDKDTYSSLTDLSAGGGMLEFLEELEDVEVVSGDVVLFKVCVTGRPEPTVMWFKDDSEIKTDRRHVMDYNSEGEHTLLIKNISDRDECEFRCVATNSAGEVSCSANLLVHNI